MRGAFIPVDVLGRLVGAFGWAPTDISIAYDLRCDKRGGRRGRGVPAKGSEEQIVRITTVKGRSLLVHINRLAILDDHRTTEDLGFLVGHVAIVRTDLTTKGEHGPEQPWIQQGH